jgi:hypothetical protein
LAFYKLDREYKYSRIYAENSEVNIFLLLIVF